MKSYTDLAYLKELTDDDEDLILQSLKRYAKSSAGQLQNLVKSTTNRDWDGMHNSAHSLFATTQIVGILDVAQPLKDIQLLAREKRDFYEIEKKVEAVKTIIAISYEEINGHINNMEKS